MSKKRNKVFTNVPFIMMSEIMLQYDRIKDAVMKHNMYYYIPVVKPSRTKSGYSLSLLKLTDIGLNLLGCKKVKLKVHNNNVSRKLISNFSNVRMDNNTYPNMIITINFKDFLDIIDKGMVDDNILRYINYLAYDAITLISYDHKIMGYVISH